MIYALSSKAFLSTSNRPLLLSSTQSLVGAICSGLYVSKKEFPIKPSLLGPALLIIIFTHCLGTILTDVSTRLSSASFVNTLKAAEPLYTIFISRYVLKERFTLFTYLSLLVIVGGVFITCITEFNFVSVTKSFMGFWQLLLEIPAFHFVLHM